MIEQSGDADRPVEDDPTGMRALLRSLPDPGPMPDHLVRRIQATLAEAEGVHGLKRTLSAFDLVMLGIGAVIGAGIFYGWLKKEIPNGKTGQGREAGWVVSPMEARRQFNAIVMEAAMRTQHTVASIQAPHSPK